MAGHPFHTIEDFDPIRVQCQTGPCSDDDYAHYLEEQTLLLREVDGFVAGGGEARMVMIIHPSMDIHVSRAQRQMASDWMRANEMTLRRLLIVTHIVVPGIMLRAALTAILWLVKPQTPLRASPTLESAVARAIADCEAAGLPVPPLLREEGASAIRRAVALRGSPSGQVSKS